MIDGKIISAFAPTVPMWEVYYDQGELHTCPVLALALVEPSDSDHPELDRCVFPMTLQDRAYIDHPGEPMSDWASNTLGYSFEADPKKEDWESEIKRYEKGENGRKTKDSVCR
jgi:hypothetical protein